MKNSIVINLMDYSKCSDMLSNQIDTLKLIWLFKENDNTKNYINKCANDLCNDISKRMIDSDSKDIKFLNLNDVEELEENDKSPMLFTDFGGEKWTAGYIGVISLEINGYNVTVNFKSRFDNENSWFSMYVFEKTYKIKTYLFDDMIIQGTKEKIWDFLLMITFVKQMHNAMKKGLYRQYTENYHNDSNIKGRIDISRHLKENMLSNGKIAYITRDYDVNNPMNILILKACECLNIKYRNTFQSLLNSDDIIRKGVLTLKNEVQDWQSTTDKVAIKQANKKIVHSVYKNYEPLRQTAILILKRLGVNYLNTSTDSISGILVDMSKMWEEFLENEIFNNFPEAEANWFQQKIEILDGKRTLKPDYLIIEKGVVFDAKYKKYWGENLFNGDKAWESRCREDAFQILSYMYALNCKQGGIIFPVSETEKYNSNSTLKLSFEVHPEYCKGDTFHLIPLWIPKLTSNNDDFRTSFQATISKTRIQIENIIDESAI